MSMRTFDPKKLLVAGFGLLGLAACDSASNNLGFLDPSIFASDDPPEVVDTTLAQTVRISAPDGYCVDTGSRKNGLGGSFVILAPCAGLKVPGIEWPQTVAVMTISATRGAVPAASATELEALLTSPEGRGLLASMPGGPVDVLQTESLNGAFFARVSDPTAPVDALETVYWRGLIAAGGRLVSLTVRGYDAEPLSAADGLSMIQSLARDIRQKSATPQQTVIGGTATGGRNPFAGLFRNQE